MALTICTFLWGAKYSPNDVLKLRAGLARHLKQEFQFAVFCDDMARLLTTEQFDDCLIAGIWDRHLLKIKGCFARLRMFDPAWQRHYPLGQRLVCMDLDTVITGPLDPLFDRPDNFSILTGANSSNPCPYNGSLWMLRAGYRPDVWSDFSLDAAAKTPFYEFPDDQGWFAHKLPGVTGWKAGSSSGIYAFQKPGWPRGESLPPDARMVVFPGWRDPSKFQHLPWIKENWAA